VAGKGNISILGDSRIEEEETGAEHCDPIETSTKIGRDGEVEPSKVEGNESFE